MLPRSEPKSVAARILVVEDEVLVRVALADALRAAGFSVVEAATADEALSYLQAGGHVDLIFSDINMPGSLDGLELAYRIRDAFPFLAIILTSGYKLAHNLDGFGRFIQKPYDIDHAVAAVREMLGHDSSEAGE